MKNGGSLEIVAFEKALLHQQEMDSMDSLSMYRQRVKRVLPFVDCSPYLMRRFLDPHDTYEFGHIPVFGKDGMLKGEHDAWLSLWWSPFLRKRGGIRYDAHVSKREVQALSGLMFIKIGALGLPWGGAKLGVKIDPAAYTPWELDHFTQNLIERIRYFLGKPYFAASDMNTGNKIGVMLHAFAKVNPHPEISPYRVFSGKPEQVLGLGIRTEATGLGGIFLTEFMLSQKMCPRLKGLNKATMAIQGFGQVARPYFKYAEERGASIIAVADESMGFYNASGISYARLMELMKGKRAFAELQNGAVGDAITNDELLALQCDVLVLGAREGQMTAERARRHKALLDVELANNPTDIDAEPIIKEQGGVILADVITNAGGVGVSADEVDAGESWGNEPAIRTGLERSMKTAGMKIVEIMRAHALDVRDAAYLVSLRRTIEQVKAMRIETLD